MVSVFLWPQCGQVRVAVRTVMQGIIGFTHGGVYRAWRARQKEGPAPSSRAKFSRSGNSVDRRGTVSPPRLLCWFAGGSWRRPLNYVLATRSRPALEGPTMRTPRLLALTITVAAVLACGDSQ